MVKVNGPEEGEASCEEIPGPTNPMVTPLLTDLYQFTMAYAYWKAGKHRECSAFDLYFRRNPFGGEYTVLAGLEECVRFIAHFKFWEDDISFVRQYHLRVSNVAAGKFFGIPLRGTHSHAFVSSYMSVDEIVDKFLCSSDGSSTCDDFVSLVQTWLTKIQEIKLHLALASYALAFPANFLALVDTYDVMRSGVPNFCTVALALNDLVYKAIGIRLDYGDLAYLSYESCKFFTCIEEEFGVPGFGKMNIAVSNDLNEETFDALNKKGHELDAFGIGTYLVTCYAQATLGSIFKLVEINNQPHIKLSDDVSKVQIIIFARYLFHVKKRFYRLYGKESFALLAIMTGASEPPRKFGERILCRHPFNESKRAYVVPQCVEELLKCYWPGQSGQEREELPPLKDVRARCIKQLEQVRPNDMRRLNPTPYKVSVSTKLYDFIHFLWLNEAPVRELQ